MDGDPSVEPELDSLSRTLPLPYRVALIVVLGTWGWGANLQALAGRQIDVPALLRYPARPAASLQPPHHASAYRLAAAASGVLGASLAVFWALTRRDAARVLALDWLPMGTLVVLGCILVFPVARGLPQNGRRRFAATLRRVALGGLAEPHHGKFADVLLADVLTSYAKVLGDLYVCVCMFFFTSRAGRAASATDRPDRSCGGFVVVPLILAWPSLARLRQCLIEYGRARRAHVYTGELGSASGSRTSSPSVSAVSSVSGLSATGSTGASSASAGGQHLANALKYATAFPVIALAALQRQAAAAAAADGSVAAKASAASLHRAWLVAVAVNSLYSFYWDVARDWDLTLFSKNTWSRGQRPRRHHPYGMPSPAWGLRRRLLLRPAPAVYYGAVVLDLCLRCTWAMGLADAESGVFAMQVLEVVRRWVWLFFRIETEYVRATGGDGNVGGGGGGGGLLDNGPGSTDILLGDVSGKYDEED